MKRQAPKSNKSQQYCCVAVGSRDRSLSVWMTALQRPLVVIHDLFEDSILDLSWSSHGYILLACSVDGTVVSLQFSANELGTPLTEDDKNSLYQRMYGKSANFDMTAHASKEMIIENVELLNVTNDKPKPPVFPLIAEQIQKSNFNSTSTTNSTSINNIDLHNGNSSSSKTPATPTKPISKQIETRTADGKRRITPMFIPLSIDDPAPEFSSSSRSTTNIVVEKINLNASQPAECVNNDKSDVSNMTEEIQKESNPFMATTKIDARQIDTRLSKPIPTTSQIIKDSNDNAIQTQSQVQTQNQSSKSEQISYVTKPLSQSGGKAVPIKGSYIKSAGGDLRVQVINIYL